MFQVQQTCSIQQFPTCFVYVCEVVVVVVIVVVVVVVTVVIMMAVVVYT